MPCTNSEMPSAKDKRPSVNISNSNWSFVTGKPQTGHMVPTPDLPYVLSAGRAGSFRIAALACSRRRASPGNRRLLELEGGIEPDAKGVRRLVASSRRSPVEGECRVTRGRLGEQARVADGGGLTGLGLKSNSPSPGTSRTSIRDTPAAAGLTGRRGPLPAVRRDPHVAPRGSTASWGNRGDSPGACGPDCPVRSPGARAVAARNESGKRR